MKLFVYQTPEETPTDSLPDCAIAIDVLRATTTMAAAFAAGAEAIETFSDLDKLIQASEQWPLEKRILAGERGGKRVDGFDLGNSPRDHSPELTAGRRLFMSTTNGTRCLERIQAAPVVMTAALTTRRAVVDKLLARQPETVWLVGSGWEGTNSLEDTVCAGAIIHSVMASTGQSFLDCTGNDSAVASVALYEQWQDRLLELIHLASHGQRLLRLDNTADLEYCARIDMMDIVPEQESPGVLVNR
ncbi:2-phosphosulfolactate phosphatase family protein [Leptothoe sp. PORK10 BA2]|uniref:2-phosphosulfolactate phosphatase family protein n=1 Tax=Leptothoe sp. PORK10 BA2 TaxID=3110254 RepID=UPI002B1FF2DF|nr:2-phosphosulfolactate phosphatase family protein [Leptothoe sp. PORK10 BA2]MEA5464304.1 2-phosphosulfolactate phosphatase family protein [Leptothoe sp. PORK10 BA2]